MISDALAIVFPGKILMHLVNEVFGRPVKVAHLTESRGALFRKQGCLGKIGAFNEVNAENETRLRILPGRRIV